MDYSTINNKKIAIKCNNWLQSFKLLRQLSKNGFYWKNNDDITFLTFWSKNTNCYNVVKNKVMLNNEEFYKENDFTIIEFKNSIIDINKNEEPDDLNRPIYNIGDVAVRLCEILSCENCPVTIYNCDNRTEYEKTCLHVTCCEQLMKWIENQSKS